MKRVVKTKKPSFGQMKNMAFNLRAKTGRYSALEFCARAHTYKGSENEEAKALFSFYIDNTGSMHNLTWEELQTEYFERMKKEEP